MSLSRVFVGIALCLALVSGARADWPTKDWTVAKKNAEQMQTPACRDWQRYLFDLSDQKNGLKTDALLVIRHGVIEYEFYDGVYDQDTPHCLWSASKTVAATLLGIAVKNGEINLDDPLAKYYPASLRRQAHREGDPNEKLYEKIRISDLLEMGAGFDWNEDYEGDIRKSSVLDMIYLQGYRDTARFAARAPMRSEGPGNRWLYNSGNSNLLMGVLKQVYKDRYDQMPWKNLFDVLGMKHTSFEKDRAGVFMGASYVHASPRDMARLGLLLLHDGVWDGTRVLPEGWVSEIRKVSPAVLAPATPKESIQEEGVFGRSVWLNEDVKGLGLPFPRSPRDLFFAAGHYGQLIYVIPSLDMVIVRTAHDVEYWSKIDAMVSKTVACFAPSDAPLAESRAPVAKLKGALREVSDLYFGLKSGLLSSIYAKELCSCHFVGRLSVAACLARSNLPSNSRMFMNFEVDESKKTVRVTNRVEYGCHPYHRTHSIAAFDSEHPQYGCSLAYGPAEDPELQTCIAGPYEKARKR